MTPREPVPEMTPRVGRWAYALPTWLGDCLNGCEWNPSVPECPNCGTIRPPAPSAPVVETGVGELDARADNGKARAWLMVHATLEEVASDAMNAARGNGKSGVEVACEVIRSLAALRAPRPVADASRVRGLLEAILANDPDAGAADGVTLLEVWRTEAAAILSRATPDGAPSDG